ncbi:DUF1830 domain-containing protein [Nostoc sp. MG11]|uniref:DUF1830 domain-containing protein n=1 Tax=Nostoc sp. MG11 TaxID=2721166 RepID=UPI001867CEB6|nr:DUF1830 domain-containing protein [Nostoc sp. MG11]
MPQLPFLPCDYSDKIPCGYVNATNRVQIVRITNIPNWYLERVVFPGQRLLFKALPDANLEIYTSAEVTALISDTIRCCHLQIQDFN